MKAIIKVIAVMIIALSIVIKAIVIRLENPDMTDTRILITYYPYWIIMIIGAICAYFLLRSAAKNSERKKND